MAFQAPDNVEPGQFFPQIPYSQSTPRGNDFGINTGSIGPSPSLDVSQGATHDYNPTLGLSREAWRDQYQGLGNVSPQAADAWLRSHGATNQSGKGDVWQTPYGDQLDLQIGRGAANANGGNITTAWTPSSGGSSNGSVMGNSGAPQGFDMQQFINALSGGVYNGGYNGNPSQAQPGMNYTTGYGGAQPYNPNAPQQGVSSYFNNPNQFSSGVQQAANQMQTTGQTNGTLLGTQMSNQSSGPVGTNVNQPQQSQPANKPSKWGGLFGGAVRSMGGALGGALGAPSFYNQNKDTQTKTNPLPNNNMMGGSF